METNEILIQLLKGQEQMNKRLDKIENRLDSIEEQIEDIKEDSAITRSATNRNGEKLEELVTLLNNTNVVSFKYYFIHKTYSVE